MQALPAKVTERHNGNVHRAAADIIVFKSRAARGSVCNVLLSCCVWRRRLCDLAGPEVRRIIKPFVHIVD